MTPLTTILDEYVILNPVAPRTAYQLRHCVALFTSYLGHPATTADLTDLTVSAWIQSQEGSFAPRTIATRKTVLSGLWRFAAGRGYCSPPGTLRRVRVGDPMPRAWSLDEMHRLLSATLLIKRSAYWRAFLLMAYESGLRRSDLIALDRSAIGADGVVVVRMAKTRHVHACQVRPETAALALALDGQRPLEWPHSRAEWWRYFRRLRQLAGVDGGAAQQLRRTGATWVAREQGVDAARRFLGHRSPAMIRYYLDERIARPVVYLPPKVA